MSGCAQTPYLENCRLIVDRQCPFRGSGMMFGEIVNQLEVCSSETGWDQIRSSALPLSSLSSDYGNHALRSHVNWLV